MIKHISSSNLRVCIISAMILLITVFTFSSCKRVYFAELVVDSSSGGEKELLINARFPLRSEIKALFKASLVDSGIVPVEVVVKNAGERKLVIHHPNSISLPESFWGINLHIGGMIYQPIRPIEAYAVQVGLDVDSVKAYRIKVSNIITGMMFAPYGMFLVYKDVRYNRVLRAIGKESFFPVDKSGVLMPVELDPGESKKGFVFFDLPEDLNPYVASIEKAEKLVREKVEGKRRGLRDRAKKAREKRKELEALTESRADSLLVNIVGDNYSVRVVSCFSVSGIERAPIKDISLAPEELFCNASESRGGSEDIVGVNEKRRKSVFILADFSKNKRKLPLFHCYVDEFGDYLYRGKINDLRDLVSGDGEVVFVKSRSASITSSVVRGNRGAVAVNFKSSSKVFLWNLEKMKIVGVVKLGERVKKIFISDKLIVLTDRDFLHLYSLEAAEREGYFKFGRDICDALCFRGRIFGVQKNGVLRVADISMIEKKSVTCIDTLSSGDRRIIGRFGDRLLFLTRGKWSSYIFSYNISMNTEKLITRLPAHPVYYSFDKGRLTVQLPDGTFVTYGLTSKMRLKLLWAGSVPFDARLIVPYNKDELMVIGKDGAFAIRSKADFEPCSIDRVTAEHVIRVIYPEQSSTFREQ